MRWFTCSILAYVSVALQLGLSRWIAFHGAAPMLPLLAVIFIAVNAPREAALLACFGIGLLQDLVTVQPPGLLAFSYGLVALFIVGTQRMVYKGHPLTHFSLALVGGLITAAVLLIHAFVRPAGVRVAEGGNILPAHRLSPTVALEMALYTAILAPFILAILQRFRGVFGFQGVRRKGRAW